MEVVKKQSKIITTLRARRRIEEAIRSLACISRSGEAEREAKLVADMGEQVVPALIGLLDTYDPRLLGTLGLIATHLHRTHIARALRDVATEPARSDRARLAALLILEKFLGEQPDDSLYQRLQSPETAVVQSLVAMVERAARERDILCEYVRAIEQQPDDDVIQLVLNMTFEAGPECAVVPFWALAQSKRQDVAASALRRMGSRRLLNSAVMLQALLPTLSPARRPLAERSLRKLRFSGADVPALEPPHPAWRALVSPIDSQGSQSILFVLRPQKDAPVCVLSVLLNDLVGVWDAAYDMTGEVEQSLPSEPIRGAVHRMALSDASAALPLLEASFDTGRRLVREALAVNHARAQVPPLSYAVVSDTLWKWDSRSLDEPRHLEPPLAAEVTSLRPHTAQLLDHPAFEAWFVQSEALVSVARQLGWASLALSRSGQRRILNSLIHLHFEPEQVARYCNRLERMAHWLQLADDKEAARLALVAAQTLKDSTPEAHPLARRMVERGLAVALRDLASGVSQ